MEQIWVAVITSVVAPALLFLFQTLKERRVGIQQTLKDLRMVTLRLEILFNLAHNSEDRETILKLYDKYHNNGGNSYITKRINDKIKEWELADKKKRRKK